MVGLTPYNPTQDLTVNPRSFIKQKVNSATKELKGLPPQQATTPMVKSSGIPTKPMVTPSPKVVPEISTPSLSNVSASLPQVSQEQVKESVIAHTPKATAPTSIVDPNKSLADLAVTLDASPNMSMKEINQYFPEFSGKDQAVLDYIETMKAKPDLTFDEIKEKFPEFYTDSGAKPLSEQSLGESMTHDAKVALSPIVDTAKALWSIVTNQGDLIDKKSKGEMGEGSYALQSASNASNVLTAPIQGLFQSFVDNVLPEETKKQGEEGVQKFLTDTSAGQALTTTVEQWNQFSQKHPEAADDASSLVNLALNLVGGSTEKAIVENGGKTAVQKVVKPIERQVVKTVENQATKKAENSLAKTWDAVSPEMTKAEREARMGLSKKRGLTQKTEYGYTKSEVPMIETAQEVGANTKDAVANYKVAKNALKSEGESLKGTLEKVNLPGAKEDISLKIIDQEPPLSLGADQLKTYERVKEATLKMVDGMKEDGKSVLETRIKFDNLIDKEFPNLWDAQKWGGMKNAVYDIRDVFNNYLSEKIGNDVVKKSLQKQANLYKIIDNVATRAEKPGTTGLKRRIKKNPVKSKIIGGGLSLIGAAKVGAELSSN